MTRWLWTAPDGSTTDLSAWGAGNYVTGDGTVGQFAPGYEFATQAYAAVDGARLQQITAQPAQPVLGLDLVASDPAELRARLRSLAHVLRPRAGIGTLTAVGDDGMTRTLRCYYRSGLEAGRYVANRFRAALEFWSPSPWWRGEPLSLSWTLAAATAFFPILPVRLSASTIEGATTVDLSGTDAPTYPLWTVTGPGSQLTLRNEWQSLDEDGAPQERSAELVLNAAIGDGELVVIDSRPGRQSVHRATPVGVTMVEHRRNLIPNPQVAISASSWLGNAGTGGAATGGRALIGGSGPLGVAVFYRLTYTTGNTTAAGADPGASIVVDGRLSAALPIQVTPGQVYSAAIYGRSSIEQRLECRVYWYDGAGTLLTVGIGAAQVVTPNTWHRFTSDNRTAPASAQYVQIILATRAGAGAAPYPVGGTLDAGSALFEQAPAAGDFFTGSSVPVGTGANLGDLAHYWEGAGSASESVQTIARPSGRVTLGASLFGSLASDPAMWPLVDGVNSVSALLIGAGPASRIDLAADRLHSGAL
jgi:hypothetical protein